MTYDLRSVMPQPSKPKRPAWVAPVVAALAALTLAVVVLAVVLAQRPEAAPSASPNPSVTVRTLRVEGSVVLYDPSAHWQPEPGFCSGTGGYSDLHEGSAVVITDATGKTVGVGELDRGGPDETGTECHFSFGVNVPAGLGFYGITVSHRGTVQYREADLAQEVALSIGR